MAGFPALLKKLFANSGLGPKLRSDILPDGILTTDTADERYFSKDTTIDNVQNAVNAQNATNATNADTANKAVNDSDGKAINLTYLKKQDAEATYAKTSDVTAITSGTEDLEAGTSELATGSVHFVYE